MKNKIYTGIVVALFVILAVFLVLIAVTTVKELTGDESAAESEISENPWDTPDFSDPEASKETSVPDNTDISDPEVSTPETSTPEVSEPEVSKEELLAIFEERVSWLKEALKDSYKITFDTGYTVGYSITHFTHDRSTLAELRDIRYIYKDGNFAIIDPWESISIELNDAEYEDVLPYIESLLNKADTDVRLVFDTVYSEDVVITYFDPLIGIDEKAAEFSFSGDCEYDGKDATVSGFIVFRDSSVKVNATYTYQTTDEMTLENAKIEYFISKADTQIQYDVQPDYTFENRTELNNYVYEMPKAIGALPKLLSYPLNKLITVNIEESDSEGESGAESFKLIAVGTNEDFTAAISHLRDDPYRQILYLEDYFYVTDNSCDTYSKRDFWKYENGEKVKKSEESAVSDKNDYTVKGFFEHRNYFNMQNLFYPYDDSTTAGLGTALRYMARYDDVTYTDNGDGTVTAKLTVSMSYIHAPLMNSSGADNFKWLEILHQDKDLEQALCITYDNETGVLVGMTFDVYAEGENNTWYKHSFELTVTDADESMLPEKEELLAGNW